MSKPSQGVDQHRYGNIKIGMSKKHKTRESVYRFTNFFCGFDTMAAEDSPTSGKGQIPSSRSSKLCLMIHHLGYIPTYRTGNGRPHATIVKSNPAGTGSWLQGI